jgi:EAL domain-containing protein (putative c-di-GMP-specific phosphodiesterase class I)/DNA-binding response OmpR family regulator
MNTRSRFGFPQLREKPRLARRANILLIDDDESIAKFIGSVLPKRQFNLIWAPTVQRALELIHGRSPDLVILDIFFPQESGWDFLRFLRGQTQTSRVPVVILSASDDTLDRETSLRMSADRYLIKPVQATTVRRVVKEMLIARDDLWWSLSLPDEQAGRLRELLFDLTTDIPTLALVVEDLRKVIEAGERLNVYCLEIEPFFRLDEKNYWEQFDGLRREFVRGLYLRVVKIVDADAVIATSYTGSNEFYFFSRARRGDEPAKVARDLERAARKMLTRIDADEAMLQEIAVFVGGATTQSQTVYGPRILYNAVREAKALAERRQSRYFQGLSSLLYRALDERTIRTVFQPIVDLKSRRVVGYEALSRGPAGSKIESPEVIFEMARDLDLTWELEELCIANLEPLLDEVCTQGLLFFNLESNFIQQLHSRGSDVLEPLLCRAGSVVIEVTERSAIRDYAMFRQTLQLLKKMGFLIGIDDCGSGYATLEAVAELKPDYLKVGHSLLYNVQGDSIRRNLVDLVARCGNSIGAVTVAEAIETDEQLAVCVELGIQNGQGYFFAPPGPWEQVSKLKFD